MRNTTKSNSFESGLLQQINQIGRQKARNENKDPLTIFGDSELPTKSLGFRNIKMELKQLNASTIANYDGMPKMIVKKASTG